MSIDRNPAKKRKRTSARQRAANRANARKSTGPRTQAGKWKVRLNGVTHGLTGRIAFLPGEDRAAYEESVCALVADLAPANDAEFDTAIAIADDWWRLERARACTENLFTAPNPHAGTYDDPDLQAAMNAAHNYRDHSEKLLLVSLYEQRIYRSLDRNRRSLGQSQQSRVARIQNQINDLRPQNASNGFGYANKDFKRISLPVTGM